MGWFKRLCLFVFGLAGILALAALILPWVGPYTEQATWLLTHEQNYQYAVLGVVGVTALGVLICFLRSLFSPRNRKVITVSRVDGGEITVTRNAIASQAKHIVERDGTCVAAGTQVRARKRTVKVHMRVTPKNAMNVVQKGAQLHDELVEGLAGICGDTLKDVSLVFTDPQSFEEPQPDYLSTDYGTGFDGGAPSGTATDASYGAPAQEAIEGDGSYLPDAGTSVPGGAAVAESSAPADGITVPLHPIRYDDDDEVAVEPQPASDDGAPSASWMEPVAIPDVGEVPDAGLDGGEPSGDSPEGIAESGDAAPNPLTDSAESAMDDNRAGVMPDDSATEGSAEEADGPAQGADPEADATLSPVPTAEADEGEDQ